jgi:iron complex transport system ATP-binding protein
VAHTIEGKDITFRYGSENILEKLSFEIEKGSFVSILGPNGSGKSTLLKNISAELTPNTGMVFLESQDIFTIKRKTLAQNMAVVPQDTGVEFPFSVMETVLLGRMPHQKRFQGESERDLEIAKQAMELTNVWHLRDRAINELSGGERQRVIAARALTQEPKVILLDEPTSHLDLQHQLDLLELMEDLNRTKGLTVIAVLHDLNLAAQFSQKIILLSEGKIRAYGEPYEVLTTEMIREIYHVEVAVSTNEITGRLNIVPLSKIRKKHENKENIKVHLVCGGGSGVYLMEQLHQYGYQISCGVLNVGDSDWKKAGEIDAQISEEVPFAPISQKALQMNQGLIQDADLIVVLPVPFGEGNLANLKQVYDVHQQQRKKVIIVEQNEFNRQDFTGGKAERLIEQMIKNGAIKVSSITEVFALL